MNFLKKLGFTAAALSGLMTLSAFAAGEGSDGANGMSGTLIWVVLMVVMFYFMIIRPQKKKEKADRQLRASLQPGDTIVTIGGFTGKVLSIKDDDVTFETGAAKTRLTIKKWAIQSREGAAAEAEKETEESK